MKIFVRARTRAKEGSHNPRFRVVATVGGDLRFHADHMRKIDIETIATELGADIIYMPEKDEEERNVKEKKVKSK
jgi:hypothetical protein